MSNRELTEKQKKLYRLADYIESLPDESFDMATDCDTPCCIAGHSNVLFRGSTGTHALIEAM